MSKVWTATLLVSGEDYHRWSTGCWLVLGISCQKSVVLHQFSAEGDKGGVGWGDVGCLKYEVFRFWKGRVKTDDHLKFDQMLQIPNLNLFMGEGRGWWGEENVKMDGHLKFEADPKLNL